MIEENLCGECESTMVKRYCKSCKFWLCEDCVGQHYMQKHLNKKFRKSLRVR